MALQPRPGLEGGRREERRRKKRRIRGTTSLIVR